MKQMIINRTLPLLRNGVFLLVFTSHNDPLLLLSEDGDQYSVPQLAVVTVSFLEMFPGVYMNHPEIECQQSFTVSPSPPGLLLGRLPFSHGLPAQGGVVHHVHPGGLHHTPGVPDLVHSVPARCKV